MPFETFKRQRAPISQDPAITIQKRGTISFNLPALEALGSPEAVELLFDREQQLVGIRKIDPSEEHAYTLRPLGKGGSRVMSGTAFFSYYGVSTEVARRFHARMDNDMLVVDLKEGGMEVTGPRSRPSSGRTA